MAIVLDRVTTAAGERSSTTRRATTSRLGRQLPPRWRMVPLAAGAVLVGFPDLGVAHLRVGREFPRQRHHRHPHRGRGGQRHDLAQNDLSGVTNAIRNAVTNALLNPFQTLLTTPLGGWSACPGLRRRGARRAGAPA